MRIITLTFLSWIFVVQPSLAEVDTGSELATTTQWNKFYTYVPTKEDYAIEIGSMWEKQNLYWLGALVGLHVGRCPFAEMRQCQAYVDLIGGAGGRTGLNTRLAVASLRYQFVNFPSSYSPLARVFVGGMHIRDGAEDRENKLNLVYGIGFGVTTSVHQRVDLKTEFRVGGGDQVWSQLFVSANVKIDKWIDYFANQIDSFGKKTTGVAAGAIEATIDLPGDLVERIEKSVSDKPKENQPETDRAGQIKSK